MGCSSSCDYPLLNRPDKVSLSLLLSVSLSLPLTHSFSPFLYPSLSLSLFLSLVLSLRLSITPCSYRFKTDIRTVRAFLPSNCFREISNTLQKWAQCADMYGNSLCKQAGRNRFQLWSGCKLSSLLTLHTGTRCTDDDMGCMRITDTGFQQYIIGGHCKDDTGKACVVHRVVHRVHYTEFDACDYKLHATVHGAVHGVEEERCGLVNMDENGRHLGTPGANGCGIERILKGVRALSQRN